MKARWTPNAAGHQDRAGLTLIEIMLVVSLLSFVVGIGLGLFAGLNPGRRIAASVVQNGLRSAHNSAVARRASARVRIDPEAGTLVGEEWTVVGTWHFEEAPLVGALGLDGATLGMNEGYVDDDGYQGRALALAGQPDGARIEIPVQHDPAYDFSAGFQLDFVVRLDRAGSGKLLDLGRVLVVGVRNPGVLEASFVPEVDISEAGVALSRAGGKVVLRTAPGALVGGRWTRVSVRYDRKRFAIWLDGVEVSSSDEVAPVWKIEHPLVLAGGSAPFPGRIDSLVVSALLEGETLALPEGVVFAPNTPRVVAFAPGGALDADVHASPVRVELDFDDGERETVQVNLYGTVE